MEDKISIALKYYYYKRKKIVEFVNESSELTPDQIIENGEELAILEYKITALLVAQEN